MVEAVSGKIMPAAGAAVRGPFDYLDNSVQYVYVLCSVQLAYTTLPF